MSKGVCFFINDIPMVAEEGQKILWAALDAGIYIPHLCAIRDQGHPFGACRLCLVEIAGEEGPVTACSEPVTEGIRVYTQSARIERLRRTGFELLMSHHDLDCTHCAKNRTCELQRLAKYLTVSLRAKRLKRLETRWPVDASHPLIVLNPNRCVLCGKCVWVCNEVEKAGAIDFVLRGLKTFVAPFNQEPLSQSTCTSCMRCVEVCPTGAMTKKGQGEKVKRQRAKGATSPSAKSPDG
jgi:bidirectional [NiFe] hydrogenase diaphorase subunit